MDIPESSGLTPNKDTGKPDLLTKAVLDDGSGALTAVFSRELTEALLGATLEDLMAKGATHTEVNDRLQNLLIAQPVEVIGTVAEYDHRLLMTVQSARILRVDVKEEADRMLRELQEGE